ncbi:MAG: ACT domain-containing protein [Actinomycetota bacterium]
MRAGAGGRETVQGLADAVDRAITRIWGRLKPPVPVALVAVGGYGRREQCPASDVDLMVLHGGDPQVNGAGKALFYELWDAGLVVGHSIRTLKEALKSAREDFPAETSFLDARLVVGDRDLFNRFSSEALKQSRRSPEEFLDRIRRGTVERRERTGDATAELEPNLKEARGGLRDLETLRWLGKVLGPLDLAALEGDLERAAELLLRIRCALHLSTGRHEDTLHMQLHTQVAELLDLQAEPGEFGPSEGFDRQDALMRRLYRASRLIAYTLDDQLFPGLRRAAARLPAGMTEGRWSDQTRAAFLQILAEGAAGAPALRVLEHTGGLVKAIPEWDLIWCLPQRNVYHRHSVDVHCLETSATMARFFRAAEAVRPLEEGRSIEAGGPRRLFRGPFSAGSTAEEPVEPDVPADWETLAVRVAGDSAKLKDRLLLAALLHDIGKGTGEDHSVRGVRLSRAALGRMGIPLLEKEDVAWLVRSHLLLTKTAVRRNIEDEALVVELAETIGSTERLRMLYLLSAADGVATGPSAWSGWTAALVGDLFTRIYNVLDKGELVNADASRTARARESELRTALGALEASDVEGHLNKMPRMWLLTQPLPALLKQSKLMIPAPDAQELRMDISPLEQPDHWEVTVVSQDRPGLFSKISGSLALHGLNVLSAQIFTRQDGVALEVFTVTGAEGRFERVKQDAQKALRGKISLDLRLAQKRSDYAGRISKGKQEAPQVRVDNGSSDFYTVIEVHAPDRIGLLYDITRALTELELDILLAKVATYAHDVVDAFYVWDLDGQKVTEADHLREIERLILHRLSRD